MRHFEKLISVPLSFCSMLAASVGDRATQTGMRAKPLLAQGLILIHFKPLQACSYGGSSFVYVLTYYGDRKIAVFSIIDEECL